MTILPFLAAVLRGNAGGVKALTWNKQ